MASVRTTATVVVCLHLAHSQSLLFNREDFDKMVKDSPDTAVTPSTRQALNSEILYSTNCSFHKPNPKVPFTPQSATSQKAVQAR